MNPSKHSSRRRRTIGLGAEALESRSLMTGGAGNTFAIIPGTITKPGDTVTIPFTIDPANFTLPKHKIVMGIDVVPQTGSNLKPLIISVTDPHKTIVPQTFHSIYDPHLSHLAVASGAGTSAVLSPLVQFPHNPNRPVTYTVQVQAQGQSTGSFLLGFYLPGDVQGTGTVTKADLQMVKAIGKVHAGNPNYNFYGRHQSRRPDRPDRRGVHFAKPGRLDEHLPGRHRQPRPRRPSRQPAEGHQPPDRPLHRPSHARRDDHLHQHQQHVELARGDDGRHQRQLQRQRPSRRWQ